MEESLQVVSLLGRSVPVLLADDGTLRAGEHGRPLSANDVRTYVAQAFGDRLDETRSAMEALAAAMPVLKLNSVGLRLYEFFRPDVLETGRPWDTKGELHIERIRAAIVVTDQDDVPHTVDLETPILRYLASQGHPVKPSDLYRPLADYMSLTPHQRALTCGTRSLWVYRLHATRKLLVQKGLISCAVRGHWMLTERGFDRAKSLEAASQNVLRK
jgi:hypothetical protein